MKNWIKNNKVMTAVILGVLLILGISANEFLFTKDCPDCITGWQTLGNQGGGFWLGAILGSAAAAVLTYFLVKKVSKEGGVGVSYSWIIAIVAFISIAFGKACTDKANDGVTSKGGREIPVQVDSTRVPAEDLIKK